VYFDTVGFKQQAEQSRARILNPEMSLVLRECHSSKLLKTLLAEFTSSCLQGGGEWCYCSGKFMRHEFVDVVLLGHFLNIICQLRTLRILILECEVYWSTLATWG
jgi:hypothetical protein